MPSDQSLPRMPRVATLGTEVEILRYALLSWGSAPDVPAGMRALTARKSGAVVALAALCVAVSVEAIAVHFLVRVASVRVAWLVTILSVVSLVWLVGFTRALVLRPTLLGADRLVVRIGLLWTLEIARGEIAHVAIGRGTAPANGTPGYARFSVLAQPNVLLTLHRPHEARGLYGKRRLVTRVGLFLDEPGALAGGG